MKPLIFPNFNKYKFKFLWAVVFLVGLSTINAVQAEVKSKTKNIQFVPPPPPSRGMPSGRQQGAASRGGCPVTDKKLTAIVPAFAIASQQERPLATRYSVGGLTTAKHPSFWFYVPYTGFQLPIEFVLQNEQGKNVYKSSLKIEHQQAGFIQVLISPRADSLQVGKIYQWFFLVNCDSEAPPFVEGWVQRVSPTPTLTNQLKSASPEQKIALYAQNGLWYDALNALAQLRLSNPNDPNLMQDWKNLLSAAQTAEIANEPIKK